MKAAMNASQLQPPSVAHPSDVREIVKKQLARPIAQKATKVSCERPLMRSYWRRSVSSEEIRWHEEERWKGEDLGPGAVSVWHVVPLPQYGARLATSQFATTTKASSCST